jgi:hypothetical protein
MRLEFPQSHQRAAGKRSAEKRRLEALKHDKPLIRASGKGSLSERCARLNAAGYTSAEGKPITPQILSRMLKRAAEAQALPSRSE